MTDIGDAFLITLGSIFELKRQVERTELRNCRFSIIPTLKEIDIERVYRL
jgi:hypothetical protein